MSVVDQQPAPLRPHDLLVALKVHVLGAQPWTLSALAASVDLSTSGVHGSLQRLEQSRLYSAQRRAVQGRNLAEFLEHGLKYWLPARLGPEAKGIPTAASAPPLASHFVGGTTHVWAHLEGTAIGSTVVPFHPAIPEAARRDAALYELLALVECFRIGRAREQKLASEMLRQRLGAA